MDQLKSMNDVNSAYLPLLHHVVSNPSPTSSRSFAQQQQQWSTSATSSPQVQQQQGQGQGQGAEQMPLCKMCHWYWTKGGALRNVPIGGGCRKPRPMPTPVAKPMISSCKAVGGGVLSLGLGGGLGMDMGASGPRPWASSQQAAAAQLMALLSNARSVQGGGDNMHRE